MGLRPVDRNRRRNGLPDTVAPRLGGPYLFHPSIRIRQSLRTRRAHTQQSFVAAEPHAPPQGVKMWFNFTALQKTRRVGLAGVKSYFEVYKIVAAPAWAARAIIRGNRKAHRLGCCSFSSSATRLAWPARGFQNFGPPRVVAWLPK